MARTHGKILCSIWHDEDFTALTGDAQRLYLVILSQPKLNLVGLLDYKPKHLARLASTSSLDSIERTMDELERARFVVVDRGTDELLVRSFTKNDPIQFANSKLRKGVWSAWLAIDSVMLREEAVREMPDPIFDYEEVPPTARYIRTSPRTEPASDRPIEGSEPAEAPDRPIEHPTDTPPPPPPPPPPPAAAAARPDPNRPVDKSEPPNPSSHLPPFDATQVELIDPDERALGTTIAHEIRTGLNRLLDDHRETA